MINRRSVIIGTGLLTTAAGLRVWTREALGPFSKLDAFDRSFLPDEPIQIPLEEPIQRMRDGHVCHLFARFTLRAVVLSRRAYDDTTMAISPIDLALGWGGMSNPAAVSKVRVQQGGRFYMWHYAAGMSLTEAQIAHSSANMHMIPATPAVHTALMSVRRHDMIALDGYLCDLKPPSAPLLLSSRTRQDTGAGACEIVWVESLRQLGIHDLGRQEYLSGAHIDGDASGSSARAA